MTGHTAELESFYCLPNTRIQVIYIPNPGVSLSIVRLGSKTEKIENIHMNLLHIITTSFGNICEY